MSSETGVELIAAERKRQIEDEGWTPAHDAEHQPGDLARAASCYAHYAFYSGPAWRPIPTRKAAPPDGWPWHEDWWKHDNENPLHNLVRAGALIAAEIDRMQANKQ